jgi:lipopolysaccharide/colanic/teichoic acid biosynthesis glycosyltransferase
MVKLDLSYVQNWSLWLDVLLLCRTLPALVHRRGPA